MISYIFGSDNNFPSASTTQYAAINASQTHTWNGTEGQRSAVMPCAGTLDLLYIELDTAPGTAASGKSFQFTVMKNGSATGVTLTITDTATTGTDSVNTVTFAAGDTISLRSVPTGTPTLGTNIFWNMRYSTTGGNEAPLIMFNATAPGVPLTVFSPLTGGMNSSSSWAGSHGGGSFPCPTGGTIDRLYVRLGATLGVGASIQITLNVNGSTTTLTATISSGAATATDLTHSISVNAGDTLSWQVTTISSGGQVPSIAAVFTPSNNGEYFVGMAGTGAPSTAATNYEQGVGIGNNSWNATESLRQIAPGAVDVKALYGVLAFAPSAGKSRTLAVRKNSVAAGVSLTISDAATTGNGTGTATFANSDKLAIQTVPTGSPNASSGFHPGILFYVAPPAATFQPKIIMF